MSVMQIEDQLDRAIKNKLGNIATLTRPTSSAGLTASYGRIPTKFLTSCTSKADGINNIQHSFNIGSGELAEGSVYNVSLHQDCVALGLGLKRSVFSKSLGDSNILLEFISVAPPLTLRDIPIPAKIGDMKVVRVSESIEKGYMCSMLKLVKGEVEKLKLQLISKKTKKTPEVVCDKK